MDPFDGAQRFIELCQGEHPTTSRLTADFQAAIEALGFRYFACCAHVDPLHPPPQAVLMHNYPQVWVQHYGKGRLYDIDPVWRRAECDPMPFFWDTAFRAESITAAQQRMMVDATEFGIAHGFTIPLHLSWLPGALRASCSIVPETNAVQPHNYLIVETLATAMYAALNCVRSPWRDMTGVKLCPRERQCLSLAAQGKDDWAIGKLLDLSPQTVHSYIKRLMGRLGVRTRMQAVVWALATWQISYYDVRAAIGIPRSTD